MHGMVLWLVARSMARMRAPCVHDLHDRCLGRQDDGVIRCQIADSCINMEMERHQ